MTNTEAKALLNGYVERIREIKESISYFENSGKLITFGTYDGKRLEWIVIDKKPNNMTLLAKDVICMMKYNEDLENITWENCTLRKWLNGRFYNSFTSDEKNRILKVKLANKDTYLDSEYKLSSSSNYKFHVVGGNDTDDYIYIPSIDEGKVFSSDVLKASSWWWLRSRGGLQYSAAGVDSNGEIITRGNYANHEYGVRPVLNLKY